MFCLTVAAPFNNSATMCLYTPEKNLLELEMEVQRLRFSRLNVRDKWWQVTEIYFSHQVEVEWSNF